MIPGGSNNKQQAADQRRQNDTVVYAMPHFPQGSPACTHVHHNLILQQLYMYMYLCSVSRQQSCANSLIRAKAYEQQYTVIQLKMQFTYIWIRKSGGRELRCIECTKFFPLPTHKINAHTMCISAVHWRAHHFLQTLQSYNNVHQRC